MESRNWERGNINWALEIETVENRDREEMCESLWSIRQKHSFILSLEPMWESFSVGIGMRETWY